MKARLLWQVGEEPLRRNPLPDNVVPVDLRAAAIRSDQAGQDFDGGALPAPFGPIISVTSPLFASRERLRNTGSRR